MGNLNVALSSIVILIIYTVTLPSGITFEDAGYFLGSSINGGYAHPPGYPLYSIILRIWMILTTWIPFPEATKAAFLSSVLTTASVPILFKLFRRWLVPESDEKPDGNPRDLLIIPLVVLTVFSHELWEQSIIIEVYALHFLLLTLFLYSLSKENLKLAGLTLGLSLSNHPTTVLWFPLLIFWAKFLNSSFQEKRSKEKFKEITQFVIFVFLGLAPYLYLPISAQSSPPLQWGDPTTLNGFLEIVTRENYWKASENKLIPLKESFLHMGRQWSFLILLLIALLILSIKRFKELELLKRREFIFLLGGLLIHLPVMALLSGFGDSDASKKMLSVFFIPANLFLIALTSFGIIRLASKKWLLPVLWISAISITAWNGINLQMRTYELPKIYSEMVDEVVKDEKALILTNSDSGFTPLIYLKYVLKKLQNAEPFPTDLLKHRESLINLEQKGFQTKSLQKSFSEYWAVRKSGNLEYAEKIFNNALSKDIESWLLNGIKVYQERKFSDQSFKKYAFSSRGPLIEVSLNQQSNPTFISPPRIKPPKGAEKDVWTKERKIHLAELLMMRAVKLSNPDSRNKLIDLAEQYASHTDSDLLLKIMNTRNQLNSN
jgi:hypothetical protein